jgi:hypothetical protein
MSFHFFSDANPGVSGGVAMLAGATIGTRSGRMHIKAPNIHTSEAVSAGDNLNMVIPINGVLQELRVRCGVPTAFYLDSATTVFVACDDAAAKKSVWLKRRVEPLIEAVSPHLEIEPVHIPESQMVADPETKYLTQAVWLRHLKYKLNYCDHDILNKE